MTTSIIGRLALATAAVAGTIVAAAGTAQADASEQWFYVGASSFPEVMCRYTDQEVQCFPNNPTYEPDGPKPGCSPRWAAATMSTTQYPTLGWVCRPNVGAPSAEKWELNHSEQLGPFFCAAFGTAEEPNVYCRRREDGSQFQLSRFWWHT